jgi:hypothetical protein
MCTKKIEKILNKTQLKIENNKNPEKRIYGRKGACSA